MLSAGAVLVCALDVLGRGASSMPPIELVDAPPLGASATAEAYVGHSPDTIYLITSSPVFREAASAQPRCRIQDHTAFKKIASILVHEEWHIRHGSDERGAYYAQLTTLWNLGLGPETRVYHSVVKSMQQVLSLQARSRRPDLVVARMR